MTCSAVCVATATQVLSAQRSRGTDLSALQSFSYSSLQGELQVGGVFVRVFNQRGRSSANASNATVTAATATAAVAATGGGPLSGPLSTQQPPQQQQQRASAGGVGGSGLPQDPTGFCKAMVRFLYDRLVERCFRGAELQQLPASEARNVLDVITALAGQHGGDGVGEVAGALGGGKGGGGESGRWSSYNSQVYITVVSDNGCSF